MTQEEKSQQIKDIIINFSTSTKYTLDDAIDDIMALMEECDPQRFKEGQQSNILEQLPNDEEIIAHSKIHSHKYEENTLAESVALTGFRRGAKWMKSKIGG